MKAFETEKEAVDAAELEAYIQLMKAFADYIEARRNQRNYNVEDTKNGRNYN